MCEKVCLPIKIISSLAEWYGLCLKDYEIIPKPVAVPQEPPKTAQLDSTAGWTCEIRVEKEFGTVMMRVLKDGQPVAIGRSGLYGLDNVGIVQSISYAAHVCYKLAQQDEFRQREESAPTKETKFKDWVKKYEADMPPYGTFARYVKDNYSNFPAYGRKEMKVFLNMNKGTAHINAFEVLFRAYREWYEGQKTINAVNCK